MKTLFGGRICFFQRYLTEFRVTSGVLFFFFVDAQAMVGADQWFVKEAEASTRAGATWEFAAVRNSLQVGPEKS